MGLTLGLMGGGGSILTVPILVYLFGIPGTRATYYSLFIVGVCAAMGVFPFFKRKQVEFKTGFLFFLPSVLGVFISRRLLLPALPNHFNIIGLSFSKDILILILFAVVMISAAGSMLKKKKLDSVSPKATLTRTAVNGILIGMTIGFVGAGGGFLIVPALVNGLSLSMEKAVGTSLLIIAMNSLLAFSGDWMSGASVPWDFISQFSAMALVGILLGTYLNRLIPGSKLKPAFGWFVLIMGTAIFIKQAFELI